ncbi:MAG: 6-bladed beta-propeller [Rikenellaceae bacterium]|jgi:hypothetical protein|nr:6-bladed beta-propeller [Rikenellaceae bacterium]
MKKTALLLFASLIALSLVGCQSRSSTSDGSQTTVMLPEETEYLFYERVSEYGTLALETSPQSLLGDIAKIRVYKERIFLLSTGDDASLLVFDKSGRFITRVGFQGRGPQEYVSLYNFEIDPTRDELLLIDNQGQKILLFDLDGKFKQTIPSPFWLECVGRLPDGRFVLAYSVMSVKNNEYSVVAICDEAGNVLERHIESRVDMMFSVGTRDMMIARADGSLSLMPQYHSAIYRITDKGVSAEIGFEFPEKIITLDRLKEEFGSNLETINFDVLTENSSVVGDHAEDDDWIIFNSKVFSDEKAFYNKASGEVFRSKHPLFGQAIYLDDEGYCWASLYEVPESADDPLMQQLIEAYAGDDNRPLVYYRLKP